MNRAELDILADGLISYEHKEARDSLAVYAGLHVPELMEQDPGFEKESHIFGDIPVAERYVPALHHRIEIEKLEELERGAMVDGRLLDRLLILAPP